MGLKHFLYILLLDTLMIYTCIVPLKSCHYIFFPRSILLLKKFLSFSRVPIFFRERVASKDKWTKTAKSKVASYTPGTHVHTR